MEKVSPFPCLISLVAQKLPGVQDRVLVPCRFVGSILPFCALLALSFLSCQKSDLLPSELGGMRRTTHEEGERASEIINAMHGKGVTPMENLIGVYRQPGATAILHLSLFQTERQSRRAFAAMAAAIGAGHPIFSGYRIVQIEGHQISSCAGMGQVHYFFFQRERLYWLAVDSTVAEQSVYALARFADG